MGPAHPRRSRRSWGGCALATAGTAAGPVGSTVTAPGALAVGLAVTGFVVLGTGISVTFPALLAHAGAGAAHAGPALAAVSTGGYTGFLVDPTAIGGVAELAGLPAALWLLPMLTAAAGVLSSRREPAAVATGPTSGAPCRENR